MRSLTFRGKLHFPSAHSQSCDTLQPLAATIRKEEGPWASRADTTITLTDAPHDDELTAIATGLRAYTERRPDTRALAVLVRDPETKKVVGGLHGRTSLGLFRVERFFLPEKLRRGGLGSRILGMAEEEGGRRGCTRAVLSTVHFQAPGFYLKHGWETRRPDRMRAACHTRFYMTKKLS